MQAAKFLFFFLLSVLISCRQDTVDSYSTPNSINWTQRQTTLPNSTTVQSGSTYLSVYSEIYAQSGHRTFPLTATVSMRNTSPQDTIYLTKATYYNTSGQKIRSYFQGAVYIAPMETLEIVIEEADTEGGSGANFVFDWAVTAGAPKPYFEAVMISTSGQQGLSFVTTGIEK